MSYTPKYLHVILSVLLAVLLMGLSAIPASDRVASVLMGGGFIVLLYSVVVMYGLVIGFNDSHWDTMRSFAETYSKLDNESRAALGFQFPYLRYRMKKGQIGEYFENTNVSIEQFRLFLKTSNDRYISPKRDWFTREKPEWAWLEIQAWLEDKDYIVADSAAGSHSWLWKGQAYNHLCAYWLAGRHLENLSKGEPVQAFAYEVEEQELA